MTSSGEITSPVSGITTILFVAPFKIFVGALLNNACNLEAIISCSNSDGLALGLLNAIRGFNVSVSGVPASSCRGNIHSKTPSESSSLAGLRSWDLACQSPGNA